MKTSINELVSRIIEYGVIVLKALNGHMKGKIRQIRDEKDIKVKIIKVVAYTCIAFVVAALSRAAFICLYASFVYNKASCRAASVVPEERMDEGMRTPPGRPRAASPEDPELRAIHGSPQNEEAKKAGNPGYIFDLLCLMLVLQGHHFFAILSVPELCFEGISKGMRRVGSTIEPLVTPSPTRMKGDRGSQESPDLPQMLPQGQSV